jgi:hypothetical protein
MFINNKYTTIYFAIITRAKDRMITGYVEKHHVIPKSLGGNNSKSNIVTLTAKEHYICHRLLVKMTEGLNKKKMVYALNLMLAKSLKQKRFVPTAAVYQKIKEEVAKVNLFYDKDFQKKYRSLNHTGKIRSEESRSRMSAAWTEERKDNNPLKGRKTGKSWNKGKVCPQLSGTNNGFYGKTHSAEFKEQLSNNRKGKPAPWTNKKQLCCFCNKEYDLGNFKRYHGENCHYKTRDQVPAGYSPS